MIRAGCTVRVGCKRPLRMGWDISLRQRTSKVKMREERLDLVESLRLNLCLGSGIIEGAAPAWRHTFKNANGLLSSIFIFSFVSVDRVRIA